MGFTRRQTIIVAALGVLTLGLYIALGLVVVNRLGALPAAGTHSELPTPTLGPTVTSTATPTPEATATPTPPPPQTRYDLELADDPMNARLRLQRGFAYMALEAYDFALDDFSIALELDPLLAEAYVGRGEAYFHLKQWSAALADFSQALALNPELADAYAWRGYVLSERGEYASALGALYEATYIDVGSARFHLWLAEALAGAGSNPEAQAEFSWTLALDPRSIEAYVGRGLARAEVRDHEGALADLESALEIAPYEPAALNGKAWFLAWYQLTELDEAERLAARAIAGAEGDLETARYLLTVGWIQYLRGEYGEALATLEEAAEMATIEGEVVCAEIVELLEVVRTAQ
ncbi:MAG: tetratricopeptide repeat protein [Anaerolineales bacterium]|nr:MAG: tetratricopeptide repeat protein [Anaerolineales bacterium]